MQAQACLGLALLIREKAAGASPEQAARLTAEAEELFERVVSKYADVKAATEKARAELHEIRHLTIGKTMPNIKGKDSADREFKLSDCRGKVVVLTFWAGWCPPCMKLVPHERALVKRLAGKPFALVGVNRDASRERLEQCEKKHRITWRSFFDGRHGPISKEHNIKHMPTIYVLDARGVIRYKDVRAEAMDRAVDQLLAELEKRAPK
jgi:thiol-disulfide isomerase/thioredoxin